ncbi:MAG: hypothetical protein LUG18_06140 [Candidatus Azobacteroides sp.]|nr:hypothetical protein [Candidatus Azobacteroides sp.]
MMKNNKFIIALFSFSFLFLSITNGQEKANEKIIPPNWFVHNVNIVKSGNTRFGPTKTDDLYLEYELMGRQGIFDFYGYIDFPKFFGVGSDHLAGIWDKEGTRSFADLQGRMSINGLLGKGQNQGLFKEYFISTNYVGNFAEGLSSSHVLWLGLGTSINTHSKLNLDVNFYIRKTFSDYGSQNEYSLQGHRLKMKWIYPITSLFNNQGSLTYIGFGDYDFNLGKEPKEKPSDNIGSNNALQISNVLDVSYKRFHAAAVARYWYHGGGSKNNGGSFPVNTNGWGYYFLIGYNL